MISYNSKWQIKEKDGPWFPQGLVESNEPSYQDAKKEIVSRLKRQGFEGDIVFREPVPVVGGLKTLDIYRLEGGVEKDHLVLESHECLAELYESLQGAVTLDQALKQHNLASEERRAVG